MTPSLNENLITTKEAGELSGYTPDYLARLARSEKIIGRRVGHTWLVDRDSLTHFLERQGGRKIDYARALARARGAEYREHRVILKRVARKLTTPLQMPRFGTERIGHLVSDTLGMSERNLGKTPLRSHALALSTALLVVVLGAVAARAAVVPQVVETAALLAREAASGFSATFADVPARVAEKFSASRDAVRASSARVALMNADTTARIASSILVAPDLSALRMAVGDDGLNVRAVMHRGEENFLSPETAPRITTADVQSFALGAYALLASPALARDALTSAYVATGARAYAGIDALFAAYRALVDASGVRTLALAATTRDALSGAPRVVNQASLALGEAVIDATHALIGAEVDLAYGTAAAAPVVAHATVALIGATGDQLARATERIPALATTAFLRATEAPAHLAPAIASAVFDAEYAAAARFVPAALAVSERYLAFVNGTGRVAYDVSAEAQLRKSDFRSAGAVIQDAYLGALGKSAAALDSFARVPKVAAVLSAIDTTTAPLLAAVLPALSFGEKVALGTYVTLNDWYSTTTDMLALLFTPAPKPILVVAPSPSAPSTSKSSYPTYVTNLNGVSQNYVDQSLVSLKNSILATVAGMVQPVATQSITNMTTIQMVNRIERLNELTVTNGDFQGGSLIGATNVTGTNASFTNLTATNFTAGASTLSSADITGALTATGALTSYTSATAPYFVATSTTATSTFAGGLAVGTDKLVVDSTTGYVGIGTTTPWGELAVSGGASIGADYNFVPPTNGLIIQGSVGIGTTSPSAALAVSGHFFLTGSTTVTGAGSGLTFTGTGNHDITASGGTLRIGSNTIIGNIEALDSTVDIGTPATRFDKIYANEVNASTIVGTLTGGNLIAETFSINSDNVSPDQENSYLSFHRGTVSPNALLSWNAATSSKRFEFNQPLFLQDASASTTNTTLSLQSVAGQTGDVFRIASSSSATTFLNVTGAGNVGIGTASPASLLHVYGALPVLTIQGTTSSGESLALVDNSSITVGRFGNGGTMGAAFNANDVVLRSDTGGGIQRLNLYSANTMRFFTNANDTAKMTIDTAGNVGIGTTTPGSNLSVASGLSVGANYSVLAPGNGAIIEGAVGIGTTNPVNAKLQVNDINQGVDGNSGNIIVKTIDAFAIDKGGSIGLGGIYDVAGTSWVFAKIAGRKENNTAGHISGYLQFSTANSAGTLSEKMRIDSTGNVGIGTTSPVSKLSVVGESALAGGLSVGLGYAGTAAPSNGLIIQGNVGIGTTSPATTLSVTGNGYLTGGLGVGMVNTTAGTLQTSGTATFNNGDITIGASGSINRVNGSAITFNSSAVGIRAVSNTPSLLVNTGAALGFGTDVTYVPTSAGAALFYYDATGIFGQRNVANAQAFRVYNTYTDANNYERGVFDWQNTSNVFRIGTENAGTGSARRLDFITASTTRVTIDSTGNVGIGTTTPAALLDIQGSSESLYLTRANGANSNAPNLRIRKARGTTAAKTTVADADFLGHLSWEGYDGTNFIEAAEIRGIVNGTAATGFMPAELAFRVNAGGSGTTEVMRINKSGNVGIGTTSPATTLSVGGNGYFTGGLGVGLTNTVAGTGNFLTSVSAGGVGGAQINSSQQLIFGSVSSVSRNGGTGTLTLATNAGDILLTPAGNVGIGTTSPSQALSVQGNGLFSGNISVANLTATGTLSGQAATIGSLSGLVGANTGTLYAVASSSLFGFTPISNQLAKGNFIVGDDAGVAQATSSIFISSTGNVGIGTASPGSALDVFSSSAAVTGRIRSTNSNVYFELSRADASSDGYVNYKTGATGVWATGLFAGNSSFHIKEAGNERVTLLAGGNVGIGTTSPAYNLDVKGADNTQLIGWKNTTYRLGTIGAGAGYNSGAIDLYQNGATTNGIHLDGGSTASYFNTGGNVGIGTTSPNAKLNVYSGAAGVAPWASADDLVIEGSGATGISFLTPNTQAQYIAFGDPEDNTRGNIRYDHANDYMQFVAGGGSGLVINSSGNVGIGTITPAYKLDVNGSFNATSVYSNGVLLSPGTGSNWTVSGANIYRSAGNVGIGTTTPGAKLDASGTIRATSETVPAFGAGVEMFYYTPSSLGRLFAFDRGSGTYKALQIDGSTLALNYNSGGNVGIGTTTPGSLLTVAGDISQITTTSDIRHNLEASAGQNRFIQFKTGPEARWQLRGANSTAESGSNAGSDFELQSYDDDGAIIGSPFFVKRSNGNVGVGTTTPGAKLDVFSASTNDGISLRTADVATIKMYGAVTSKSWGFAARNLVSDDFGIYQSNSANGDPISAGTARMYFKSDGNVGIGTVTPGYKLDVNGSFNATSVYSNGVLLSPGTGSNWSVSGADIYRSAGNVGIGTTGPATKLHVKGNSTNGTPLVTTEITSSNNTFDWSSTEFASNMTAGNNLIHLIGQGGSSKNSGYIGFNYQGAGSDNNFLTFGMFAVDNIMNITAAGNVGIGTTTPQGLLSVSGAYPQIVVNASSGNNSNISFRTNGADLYSVGPNQSLTDNHNFEIYDRVSSASRLLISSAGYVGIGTTSPSAVLTVKGSGTGYANVGQLSDATTYGAINFSLATLSVANYNLASNGNDFLINRSTGNGIYFKEANANQMIIASGGNVGIGTTNPGALLEVSGSDATSLQVMRLRNTTTTSGAQTTIGFYSYINGTSAQNSVIASEATNNGGSGTGALVFKTTNDMWSAAPSEKMRIDPSGNVGIGTTVMNGVFNVAIPYAKTDTTPRSAVIFGSNDSVSAGLQVLITGGAAQANRTVELKTMEYGVASAGNLVFQTDGGNVGIGTTDPGAYKLNVSGDFNATNVYANGVLLSPGTGSNWSVSGSDIYRSAGNVGVGTTSPNTHLHISGDNQQLKLQSTTATAGAYASYTTGNGTGIGYSGIESSVGGAIFTGSSPYATIFGSGSAHPTQILSGGTVRMTIDTSGKVGIGTTTPTGLLTIAGTTQAQDKILLSGQEYYASGNTSASGVAIRLGVNRTDNRQIWFTDSAAPINNTAAGIGMTFQGAGTYAVLRGISTDGSTERTLAINPGGGSVGIGTTTPWGQLSVNPNGITGPAFVVGSSTRTDFVVKNDGKIIVGGATAVSGIGFEIQKPNALISTNDAIAGIFSTDSQAINKGGSISFGGVYTGTTVANFAAIRGVKENGTDGNNAGALVLETRPNGGATTERMRIDSSGNVGIGTTSPASLLEVQGGTSVTQGIRMSKVQTGNSAGLAMVLYGGASATTQLGQIGFTHTASGGDTLFTGELADAVAIRATGAFQLGTNGDNIRLTVDTAGNVGVGTTTPGQQLTVGGSGVIQSAPTTGTTAAFIQFTNTGGNSYVGMDNSGGSGFGSGTAYALTAFAAGSTPIVFATGGTEKMRILSDGNVGIGTTSPQNLLSVYGGASNAFVDINSINGQTGIQFQRDSVNRFKIYNQPNSATSYTLNMVSANTGTGLALDYTTGNVGIGTTTPGKNLVVNAGGTQLGGIQIDGTNVPVLSLSNNGTNKVYIGLATTNDSFGGVGSSLTDDLVFRNDSGTTGGYRFITAGSVNALSILRSGNVGIGTTTPGTLLDVQGATGSFRVKSTTGTNFAYTIYTNTGGDMLVGREGSVGSGLVTGTSAYAGVVGVTGAYSLQFTTNSLIRQTIDGDGNVGIGTTSPNAKLNVYSGAAGVAPWASADDLVIEGSGATGISFLTPNTQVQYIAFGDPEDNTRGNIRYDHANDYMQFVAGGGSGLVINSSGNVGIGTVSPGYKLDVNGSLNATSVYSNGVLLSPGTGSNWTVGGSNIYRSAGNVGIGTAAPGAKLNIVDSQGTDVAVTTLTNNGDANYMQAYHALAPNLSTGRHFTGYVVGKSFSAKNAAYMGFYYAGAGSDSNYLVLGGHSNDDKFVLTMGGNVGIGTTTPNTVLTVGGTAAAFRIQSNNANPSVYAQADASNAITIWESGISSVAIGVNRPAGGALSSGDMVFSAYTAGWQERMRLTNAGNVGIGTSTPVYNLDIKGGEARIGFNTTDGRAWMIGTDYSPSGFHLLSDAGGSRIFVSSAGNVGIGTTSPNTHLHISGDNQQLKLQSTTATAGVYASYTTGNGTGVGYSGIESSVGGTIFTGSSPYATIFGSGSAHPTQILSGGAVRMTLDTAGNVGIGTTSPVFAGGYNGLEVVGGANSVIKIDTTVSSGWAFNEYSVDSSTKFLAGLRGADSSYRIVNGTNLDITPAFLISSTGNVGIGTTAPASTLHVADLGATATPVDGGIRVDRNGACGQYQFTTLNHRGGATNLLSSLISGPGGCALSGQYGSLVFGASNDGGATSVTRMIIDTSGNVGVGTTDTATYKMNVNGSLNATSVYSNGVLLSPGTGSNWSVDGANIYRSAGNVSIGTTLPRARFDVTNGTANINGNTPDAILVTSGNISSATPSGNVFIQSNDAQGAGIGGTLAFGGLYRAAARDAQGYAVIRGAKENSTDSNPLGYMSFSTTNVSGTSVEQMRITSGGNVGIGTTSPQARLQVDGVANTYTAIFQSSLTTGQAYGPTVRAGTNSSDQAFTVNDATNANPLFRVRGDGNVGIGTTDPGAYKLNVNGDFNATNVYANGVLLSPGTGSNWSVSGSDIYRSTGNVGIGTTTPDSKLDIQSGYLTISNAYAYRTRDTSGTARALLSMAGDVALATNGNNVYLGNPTAAGSLQFYTGGAVAGTNERVTITSTGNVGIGTTSPWGKLSVTGAGTGTGKAFVVADSANSPKMVVLDNGNVGIGTTSPSKKLHVYDDSTDTELIIDGLSNGNPYLGFRQANTERAYIQYNNAGSYLDFTEGGVQTMVMNSGNVGIGTTSPAVALDVNGAIKSKTGITITDADNAIARTVALPTTEIFDSWTNGSGSVRLGVSSNTGAFGAGVAGIGNYAAVFGTTNATPLVLMTNAAARLNIDSSGNVGIGTTDPTSALFVSRSMTSSGMATPLVTFGNSSATGDGVMISVATDSAAQTLFRIDSNSKAGVVFVQGDGNVGIGDTSPDAKFDVKGTVCLDLNADDVCTDNTSAISDSRLKDNVSTITDGLSLVNQLRPVRFTWNGVYNTGTSSSLGFLAQEVETVFPELVITDTAGYKNLDYSKLTAVLSGAVQTLDSRTRWIQNAATSTVLTVDVAGNVGIGPSFAQGYGGQGTTTMLHRLNVDGDVGAIAFVNTSTRSAKKDIEYTTTSSADDMLAQLVDLKVATYRYTIEDQADPLRIGLIAEDTQTIAPEILSADGKGVDIYQLATFTLSGVQALAAKFNALGTRVTSLEDRLIALESGAVSSASGSPITFSTTSLASALEGFGVLIRQGIAQFNTLVFRQLVASKDADGTSSAGSVALLAGNTVAQVNNSLVAPSTKVFVTFNAQIAGSWWVSDKLAGSFRVVLSEAQASDVSFDYFLVQTEGQIATSTPSSLLGGETPKLSGSDVVAPVITMLGANPVRLAVGDTYTEPGVTVDDGSPVVTFVDGIEQPADSSTITTSSETTHIITYRAMDAAGNTATAQRSVIVGAEGAAASGASGETATSTPVSSDTTAPVVTLTGAAALELTVGDTFTDPGATATDETDGDLTSAVVVTGSVDTATEGSYTLTYTAIDAAGNSGTASRLVSVVAPL